MSTIGYATLDVVPSLRGLEGRLQSGLAAPMRGAGLSAGKTLGEHTTRSFGTTTRSGVKTIVAGLGGALVATKAVGFLKDSIGEAREAQKVTAQTRAVIKSTGGAADVSARQVANLSNAISLKTGIDDEAIQSGANLLLTFKNVRNEAGKGNDIFNQATQTITDMGAALGGDASSSAIQLGKALNDPVKGVTALTRVGVTFTDQQKAQIKTLTESGHRLKAQKIILKELTSEFGGSAAAQATAGDKMKTAWKNLEEEVGTALLPTLDHLEGFLTHKGIPAAKHFIKQMQSGKGAGGDFADSLHAVFDATKNIAGRIGDVIGALDGMPSWAKKLLAGGLIGGYTAKKLGITALVKPTLGKAAGSLLTSAKPLPVFVVNKGFGAPGGSGIPGAVKTAEGAAAGTALGTVGAATGVALGAIVLGAIGTATEGFLLTHTGQSKAQARENLGIQTGVNQGGVGTSSGSGMGLPPGTNINDLGDVFSSGKGLNIFPKGFLTDLTAGVARVKDFKDTLAGLGLLTPAIRKQLDGLTHTKVEPKIGADSKPLEGRYHQSKALLADLGHAKPMSTIDANNKPGMSKTKEILHSLGIVNNYKATAAVTVNTAAGMQALARIRYDLTHLPNPTQTINIRRVGGPQAGFATGGLLSGPGSGTSDSMLIRASSGEFVVNAAATRRHLALLQSINGQRFAAGGQVGGSGGSGGGGGGTLRIEGTLHTPFGPAQIRGIAREEINDERRWLEQRLNAAART